MRHTKRNALIVAGVLIFAGMIMAGIAFAAGFDFISLATARNRTYTYTIKEAITAIRIDSVESDIRLLPAEDGACKIVCMESDKIHHAAAVEDGVLTITRTDNRRWFEKIGIFWEDMNITVYLPEQAYESLYAESVSGDIRISADFTFGEAILRSTSGDISFRAAVRDDLELKTVSGDAELSGISCRNLRAKTTSGELDLSGVTASGGMQITTTSGDVELNGCDAASLAITTTSGDVEGTLLTEKTFITDTVSGEVKIPRGTAGGECRIRTTSGDIEIRIGIERD